MPILTKNYTYKLFFKTMDISGKGIFLWKTLSNCSTIPLKAVHEKVFVKQLDGPDPVPERGSTHPGPVGWVKEPVAPLEHVLVYRVVNVDFSAGLVASSFLVCENLALDGDGADPTSGLGLGVFGDGWFGLGHGDHQLTVGETRSHLVSLACRRQGVRPENFIWKWIHA